MKPAVAYLINQYPKVSHSFIRTEILALEKQGVTVQRIAMRGWDAEIVDPLDMEERARTRYVLQKGAMPLVLATLAAILGRPMRFSSALSCAWMLSRGGERGLFHHLIYLAEACLILRWLSAPHDVNHVHAHFGSNASSVALLLEKLGGPAYSVTIHGSEEFDKPLQWKLREKIANARAVIAISSFCRSQVFRWAGPAHWQKVAVVHCAIDPRFVEAATTPPPLNNLLVCVGRLCEQKGQLLLIDAIASLHARGVPARLVLAGDGDMRAEVEQRLQARGLAEHVTITGWVSADEIEQWLEQARALVLPSFAEGLPVVIMEAMARRRPVISTFIGGIPELVRDGIEGLLIPAGDTAALADAIERLLSLNEVSLTEMGDAARDRALQRHDSATEAAKLAALFSRSTAQKRSSSS